MAGSRWRRPAQGGCAVTQFIPGQFSTACPSQNRSPRTAVAARMCPSSWRTSWLGGVSASLRVSSSRRCHTRPHCYRLCRTRSRFPPHRSAPSGPRFSAALSCAFSKRTPSILTARRSAGHQPVGSPLPLLAHPRKHHPPFGTYPPGTEPIAGRAVRKLSRSVWSIRLPDRPHRG